MKFSTVEIHPGGSNHNEWKVLFTETIADEDRVNERQGPHDLGFYHYPQSMGKQKAFDSLKSHLVAKHEKKIAALTKSLAKLKALKMPKDFA